MSDVVRVLALDYGERRIGVAISDPLGMLARPYEIIHRESNRADFDHLKAIIIQKQIGKILVGLATDAEGNVGRQAEKTLRWAEKLAAEVRIPISLWDESYSSDQASEIRARSGQRAARGKPPRIDDVAAAVFLQEYLDAGGARDEPGRPLDAAARHD